MKISKKALAKMVKSALNKNKIKGFRKSSGSEVEVGKTKYSFIKYLNGHAYGDWNDADVELQIYKSLNTQIGSQGGFRIPEETSSEIIELLRAKAVVRNMAGVRTIPMKGPSLNMGRVDSGAVVSWGSEGTALAENTDPTLGDVKFELKRCQCLYKPTREFLKWATPEAEAFIKTEMAEAMALDEDLQFIEGPGGTRPRGIYYNPQVLNTDLSGAADFDDVDDAMYQIEAQNGALNGWVANPRLKNSLKKLKDSQGRYLWSDGRTIAGNNKAEMNSLQGYPLAVTTQVPITLRPAASESYLIGGDWTNFLIGEDPGFELETTTTGGDAFVNHQMWIKLVRYVDCVLRHPETFAVVSGISA
jgi:HK97 family phage major capsid protein